MKNERKELVCVNVANDFYPDKFELLKTELCKGNLVHIYVDCIGHTRAGWVEATYVKKLKSFYGDRFTIAEHDGWQTAYCLLPKELTKEEKRTVSYWAHCIKEVARTSNLDIQLFIDALKEG